jgi:hypothetical protein
MQRVSPIRSDCIDIDFIGNGRQDLVHIV